MPILRLHFHGSANTAPAAATAPATMAASFRSDSISHDDANLHLRILVLLLQSDTNLLHDCADI